MKILSFSRKPELTNERDTAPDQQEKRKTALVTGAASGIGLELARLLNRDQHDLILIDIDPAQLSLAKQDLQADCPANHITTMVWDLAETGAPEKIFQTLEKENLQIDILINNAGFGVFGFFSSTDWRRESRMIHLHIHNLTHLTKLFLPAMIQRQYGHVLNVASVAAFQPSPLMAIYNASKAYVLSFSEAIANELEGTGVSVTVLCPGLTPTGFQNTVGTGKPEYDRNRWFTTSAEVVARTGYRDMLRGKTISIPGKHNLIAANASRFLPRKVVTSILRKVQEQNRRSLFAEQNRPKPQ